MLFALTSYKHKSYGDTHITGALFRSCMPNSASVSARDV